MTIGADADAAARLLSACETADAHDTRVRERDSPLREVPRVLDPRLAEPELTPLDDGSIRMTAPKATGRYVAAIDLGYEYACGTGTVIAGLGIDVE